MRARAVRCLRGVNEVIEAYELGRATGAAAPTGIDPETLAAPASIESALQRQAPEPARRTAPRRRTAGTRPPGRTS